MGREQAYHVSDTLTKHGSSNGQRLRTAVYHSTRISFLNVNPQLTMSISEMGHVGNPANFSNHGEGGGWDDRAEARLVQERNQDDRSVESRRKIEKLRLEVRVLKEDKEGLKQQVLALQAQALEADKKHK
jgi:hypothetical protein